jgi:3-methyl-2-oxobutanoate hydroxymethyltransferase
MIKFPRSLRKTSGFSIFLSTVRRSFTDDAVSVNMKLQNQQSQKDFSQERKMSALELQHLRRKGRKIAMITAYDYPSAKHAENAGFDILLVGDSVGMVCLGYDTTQPVTMNEMLHHCKAARRGAPSRFIVGDMPFGSYESGSEEALKNAFRLIKEAGCDAVKLEGGKNRAETVAKLVDSGIAVMGHVGLTPQGISVLGGFRAQGRTAIKARSIIDDALALQQAGAFAVGKRKLYYLSVGVYLVSLLV